MARAAAAGGFGYIVKPFDSKELLGTIEVALTRHKLEDDLAESRRLLHATLSSIGEGVVTTDARGQVTFMNRAAETITGWTLATGNGKRIEDVIQIASGETGQALTNPVRRVLESGEHTTLAPGAMLVRRDGQRLPISDSAAPIRDERGQMRGAVMAFRDVTERARLEEELRQAQTMEAVGRLAAGVAHDFNNLLTAILGHAELLKEEARSTTIQSGLDEILRAAERAAEIARQLLSLGRRDRERTLVVDLNEMVQECVGVVQSLIGERIALRLSLSPRALPITANSVQLLRIFANLASNARDAMPDGGELRFETSVASSNPAAAAAETQGVKQWVRLIVHDTGTGMDEETRKHAFEPYYTTKSPRMGAGLGLASVHAIVTQFHGTIRLVSDPGDGLTIEIMYPLSEEPITPPNTKEPPPAIHRPAAVLVVEDEEMVLRTLERTLASRGYRVLTAMNVTDAKAAIQKAGVEIDLVISDIMLPDGRGTELVPWVAENRPNLRVLLMTGYADEDSAARLARTTDLDVLRKPFSNEQFLSAVADAVARHGR